MAHTYQLQARLESGEVSELYRGLQDRNREVALKLFSPRFSDPDYARALAEAARQVGGLANGSILHFEDIGLAGGRLCCVRAHFDGYHLGTALSRLASKEVVLPGPTALQIGVEVMRAVGAAHQAGVVHGALTPANIFVTREGRVFVTDFLALWAMRQSAALRSLADRGRQAYRAPELAKGADPDPASDVYSVGAILYELLTLREVAGTRSGGVSTRRDVLVPPSRLDRRVNARLDPLVLRALEPLRSRRQKNCLEMADAFSGYLAAQGAAPGRAEIARFVAELFPNEVNLAGSTSELPFTREFSLDAMGELPSLPGLKVDVAERVSYSLSVADLEVPEFPPTASKTDQELEPAKPPRAVSDWEAPPGQLDPAVVRRQLSEPARPALEVVDTQPLPQLDTEKARRPAPQENFKPGDSRTDVETNPAPIEELLGQPSGANEPKRARPAPAAVARPRAERREPEPRKDKKPDWHPVYEPPPPPPKPKTPTSWWVLAVLMAGGAAVLAYLGAMHKSGRPMGLPSTASVELPAPPHHDAPPPPVQHAQPAPAPVPHKEKPPAKAVSYCLSISTDVADATATIDGTLHPMPVSVFVPQGDHTVVLRWRKKVLTQTFPSHACPGKLEFVSLLHAR